MSGTPHCNAVSQRELRHPDTNQESLSGGTNMTKRCSYLLVLSALLVGAISAFQPSNENDAHGDLRHGIG